MKEALWRLLLHRRSVRVCQIAMGCMFAWAGLAKLGDLKAFSEQVHNFRLVPVVLENLVAMCLPWIEVVAALALVLGLRARAGAAIATVLMGAFTVAVAVALARGLDIECGCFGTADASHVGWVKLLQNVGMLGLAAIATLRPRA